MNQSEDGPLVAASAERLYGHGQKIWDPSDRWNAKKRHEIDRFGQAFAASDLQACPSILDAGCGSEPYKWLPTRTVSLDRFWLQARARTNPVAADLAQLPFRDRTFGFVVCVASVLNYASAAEAIHEMARVTLEGGKLLLHFETSTSFEQLGDRKWGNPAVRVATFNNGREDTLWIYRPSYILGVLKAAGFRVVRQHRFHILSALGLRAGLAQHDAARLAAWDGIMQPFAGFADDVILLAERRGASAA